MKLEKIKKDETSNLSIDKKIEGYIIGKGNLFLTGKTPEGISIWTPDTPYLFEDKEKALTALKEESNIDNIKVYKVKSTKTYRVEEGV